MNARLKAEIICTGSELLGGKLNLYVPLFYERLAPLGFAITREQSCGDGLEDIASCMRGALSRADLVLVCGGLGPTFDDLTRAAAARVLGRSIYHSKECEGILRERYGARVRLPNLKDQCRLVAGAKYIRNDNGTAFGELLRKGRKLMVLLPGPRLEWEPMFGQCLNAEIKAAFPGAPAVASVKFKIAGLWEPQAEALLRPVMKKFPTAAYTILAGPYTVEFIAAAPAGSGLTEKIKAAAVKILADRIYGFEDETLASAVGKKLSAAGKTAATAESCTGGLVSELLTSVPGSSAYLQGGAVAYSDAAKIKLLGVRSATLKKYGAVSMQSAREMALGARKLFKSDYALSVTGIAGPDGGTAAKPVGLVFFALAGKKGVRVFRRQFFKTRAYIRACAANFILDELRKII